VRDIGKASVGWEVCTNVRGESEVVCRLTTLVVETVPGAFWTKVSIIMPCPRGAVDAS